MGDHCGADAACNQRPHGAAAHACAPRGLERHLLPSAHRRDMAGIAARLSPVGYRVVPLPALARQRIAPARARRAPRTGPGRDRQALHPVRRHHRQPVGEDDGKRGLRGYDAGKKITGRKRHIAVDTLGLILALVVHAADVQDRDGARRVFYHMRGRYPRLARIWADASYTGTHLAGYARQWTHAVLEIVNKKVGQTTFEVLPNRWIVERTFGWFGRYRRLSQDYEQTTPSSAAWIYLAMTHLMVRRLA